MKYFSKKEKPKKKKSILREYVESFAIALILALMIKASVVEAYKIPSGSMEDTLLIGDFLLANKFIYGSRIPIPFTNIHLPALREPKPGDIVIFKYPQDKKVNYISISAASFCNIITTAGKNNGRGFRIYFNWGPGRPGTGNR